MPAKSLSEAPLLSQEPGEGEDLHSQLRQARLQSPIARNVMGMAIALHARHLDPVIGDSTRQMETESLLMQGVVSGPIFEARKASILFSNGDAHRRRREPLVRTFAFKLLEGMRPKATSIAEELVKARIGTGQFDFLNDIAAQVPGRIIADLLGIPRSDLPHFKGMVDNAIETLGFFSPDRRPMLEAGLVEFEAYVGALLDDRRKAPKDDFISGFVAAADAAAALSEEEKRQTLISLITAGADTTKNSIAMTLALLLNHPDQFHAFSTEPGTMAKKASAEGLRFEPVALGIPRFVTQAFELDGYDIPVGVLLVFSIPAACRDPDVYAHPDTFDIARTDHPKWHFAFGGGAHRCLGEALARVEIEETLSAVARLAPRTTLCGPTPRMATAPVRLVDQMQVSFA